MKESVLKEKSYKFALRIVNLNRFLREERKEFVLSNQILRAGTSIGANIVEGNRAESISDFIHKLSIALKESFETEYWLNLLRDSEHISEKQSESLIERLSGIAENADCINQNSKTK